jgi:WD40 repeat protein
MPLPHQGMVLAVAVSPDGKRILTGGQDRQARLWDAATGKPLGPPLTHDGMVFDVAFAPPAGELVATAGDDARARLWEVPHGVVGDPHRIARWVQVITGMELDDSDTIRSLDPQTWEQRRQELESLGGPPLAFAAEPR